MNITSLYPVLMSRDVAALAAFYCQTFGFETAFETDWYVSLFVEGDSGRFELAILDADHPTVPAGHGATAQGVILNIEVADATAEHTRLVSNKDLPEVVALRDEAFGQRHFITRDIDGNLIDLIENIPPSEEFVELYNG